MAPKETPQTVRDRLERNKRWFYWAWAVIGFCIIVYIVYKLCGTFKPMLDIILLTALFSFLLRRPVNWMARHGMHRGWASVISILIGLGIVAALCFAIFPPIFKQIGTLLYNLPGDIQQVMTAFNQFVADNPDIFDNADIQDLINSAASSVSDWIRNNASNLMSNVISYGSSTITGIITLVMSLVASFWILKDLPKIGREVLIMGGPKYELDLQITKAIGVRVFGGYIRGLLIASFCTGSIAAIGFTIIGVPYAGLLGLITGILNVIPYIGPWTGGILAGIAGLFVSPWVALGSVVVSVVAQQTVDTFITPRVYGSTVELHPALVIVALSAGQAVGGVLGMVLAVPVAAAIKAAVIYWFEKRTGRQLVSEDGAFFRAKPGGTPEALDPAYDATGGTVNVSTPVEPEPPKPDPAPVDLSEEASPMTYGRTDEYYRIVSRDPSEVMRSIREGRKGKADEDADERPSDGAESEKDPGGDR